MRLTRSGAGLAPSLADEARPRGAARPATAGPFGRLRLRYLVVAVTLAGMLPFLLLAAIHPRGASIALAGALLVGAHGLFWLVVLRRQRLRLRRHGFRW